MRGTLVNDKKLIPSHPDLLLSIIIYSSTHYFIHPSVQRRQGPSMDIIGDGPTFLHSMESSQPLSPSSLPQNVSLDRQLPLSSPPPQRLSNCLSNSTFLTSTHVSRFRTSYPSTILDFTILGINHPRAFSSSFFLFRSNCVCSSSSIVSLPTSSLQSTGCQI
jgi:hypothetical protein